MSFLLQSCRLLACLAISAAFTGSALWAAGPVNVPEGVLAAESQRIETMERVAPSVVAIFSADGQSGGSGVLIEPNGFAVTNFHVVHGQGGFMKCGLNDGQIYHAVLVGVDPTGDVALIQLLGRDDFPVAKMGDSDLVRVGDQTFAMGNPFLLATDFQPTVTAGMVSGVHRYQYPDGTFLEYTDCIQVDASINPGNSGGPLFNADGELIGINGRISVEKRGRVNVGAGYAISINQVKHFLDRLKSGRIVDHATLGATVTSMPDGTVVISNILENSAAYRRGLRRNDELVSFAGRPIRSVNQFKNILGIYPKGWPVSLSFRRGNERFEIEVPLMGLHQRSELLNTEFAFGPPQPPMPDHAPDEGGGSEPDGKSSLSKPSDVPEEYLSLYEKRSGYANYAFNLQAQQRLLADLKQWGDFASKSKGWALAGTFEDDQAFEVRIQGKTLAARIGSRFAELDLEADPVDQPVGSGGLLIALAQLRSLLIDPEDLFTDFYYLGSEPLQENGKLADVLVTTRGLVISRWFFDRETGAFLGFDTQLNEFADPCVIRVSDVSSFADVQFPKTLQIRHGGEHFGTLTVNQLQFFTPSAASDQGAKP